MIDMTRSLWTKSPVELAVGWSIQRNARASNPEPSFPLALLIVARARSARVSVNSRNGKTALIASSADDLRIDGARR